MDYVASDRLLRHMATQRPGLHLHPTASRPDILQHLVAALRTRAALGPLSRSWLLGGAGSRLLGGARSWLGGARSRLGGARSRLGGARSRLGGARSRLGGARRSVRSRSRRARSRLLRRSWSRASWLRRVGEGRHWQDSALYAGLEIDNLL
jgi:hypothetical protein